MSFWRHLTRGVRVLANRAAADREVSDELQHYADQVAAEHVRNGSSIDVARRAAQREVGNLTVAREQVRAYGWENAVDSLVADVRYALRRLRGNPAFTTVSALTLALGIGATTTIFSAINPILLASLPYPNANELVTIDDRGQDGSPLAPTLGTFGELRARARSFAALAASDDWRPSITGTAEPERVTGQRITPNFFRTLGVAPAIGRDFLEEEGEQGGPKVVILSDRLLNRRFGGDRSIVGRRVMLDDREYLVVGIMPPKFANVIAPNADIWSPLQEQLPAPFNSRQWGHHYQILARLAPHVAAETASREIAALGRAAVAEFPRPRWAPLSQGMLLETLHSRITRTVKPALLVIVGAVLLLLTIACVNVTNLLLGRSAQRRGEMAMRVALGAGRSRLLRQLLTESVLLAGIGGAIGLVLAKIGVGALTVLSPPGLPRADAIHLDTPVFIFALGVTALVGLVIGVAPALGAARNGLSNDLQRSGKRTVGGGAMLRRGLVVTEVALALVLLVSAGLLMRSLERLFAIKPGFDTAHLLTMQVIDPGRRHASDTLRRQYYEQVLAAVQQVPGVTAAAFTSQLPLSEDLEGYGYEFQSRPSSKPGEDGSALRYTVTPGYFETMRIPLRQGRLLQGTDSHSGTEAIVINESLARRLFANRNPIGERVRFGPEAGTDRPWDVVVGVVGDVRQQSLALAPTDAFYVLMGSWWWVDNVQSLVVRTVGEPSALVPSIKRAIWLVDANQPIQRIVTVDGLISTSASQRRFTLVVIEAFAVAALLLAAIGLYGVLSGSVSERTREIGVRAALGATRQDILSLVMRQGLALTIVGAIIGIGVASAATRVLMSLLFEVSRLDPVTYVAVLVLLGIVAALACWLPAARAARVDPAITLRAD